MKDEEEEKEEEGGKKVNTELNHELCMSRMLVSSPHILSTPTI
jgi:hypothetical protein